MKKLVETADTIRLENVVKFEVGKTYCMKRTDSFGKCHKSFYKVIKRTKKTISFMELVFEDYEDNRIFKCKCEDIEIHDWKYISSTCTAYLPYPTENIMIDVWDMARTFASDVVDESEVF